MTFGSLTPDLQSLIIYNYETFSKFFIFFIILSVSLIYKFYWKPFRQEPTAFLSVGVIRIFLNAFSFAFLIVSPWLFIMMNPEYGLYTFGTWFTKIAQVVVTVVIFIFGLDIWRLGILGVMRTGGLDTGDEAVNKFLDGVKNISLRK